ncbi:transcriptional repressor LexA [Citreicella sp. C3M06]|uniref:transcriptional repressor LexA n=1 Tax=Roseobacteraceae TaxID=2854170 RepID=UPI001C07F981|nr:MULTISPECIES: transcriptional repressor LexA [Roseobacteraceae]MBU2962161.1 transcriptional repressor LexA [Citreicella sp. C3M06]MDO6585474.1 transcriptional repressor LexA [Salipiger sp. 1_MG-2023]
MLTKKQLDLLDFINKRLQRDGVPPSFDEMKEALDLRSKSGIHRLITALEERGFIRRLPHRARAIEIVKLPETLGGASTTFTPEVIDGDRPDKLPSGARPVASIDAVELPVMGRIAAGVPIQSISDNPAGIAVPGAMLASNSHHYALEVKGDSMIDAGINDGDVVIIRETSAAENGDIVVAQVDGYEATLKRFRRKGEVIVLEAANPAYEPRVLPIGSVKVQGKLVGLIRSY